MSVSLVTGFAGESHITSEQIARFNASVFGSGEYVTTGAGKTISAALQSANVVRVMPGDIMMKGRHVVIDSAQDLSIENGSKPLSVMISSSAGTKRMPRRESKPLRSM